MKKLFGAQYTKYTHTLSRLSKGILLIVVFAISIAAFVGSFTYVLYRTALHSKRLYALVFLAASAAFFSFSILRSIRNKSLSNKLKKILKMLIILLFITFLLVLVMLYGALFVRHPWLGAAITPVLIFVVLFITMRWRLSFFLKKYLS